LTTADLELDRGVLGMIVSEPLDAPMERLHVRGRIGTMILKSLGNASPRELQVSHGLGATLVNLEGDWRADARVDIAMTAGSSDLFLPDDVRVEGLDREGPAADGEILLPTLHFTISSKVGDIRVVD
jgi:hypothetical protein